MTSDKFNQKCFLGKTRIYRPVPGTTNICRLWIWDNERKAYSAPERGKVYEARRYEPRLSGGKTRVKKCFATLEEARAWQGGLLGTEESNEPAPNEKNLSKDSPKRDRLPQRSRGPAFKDIVEDFRRRHYPALARGTCIHYDQLLRIHYDMLLKQRVNEITPQLLDDWILERKKMLQTHRQAKLRKSFDKELNLLAAILNFYNEYYDDLDFRFPIKRRHRRDGKLHGTQVARDRDLTRENFLKVREKLETVGNPVMTALFTVQWRQALRISEAAAIFWEDVHMDFKNPENSYLDICRHVEWSRKRGMESVITPGFKNSKALGGRKRLPMFPETFEALKSLYFIGSKGLVFRTDKAGFFSYPMIQKSYKKAFLAAGIPYTGTHALRHGGCRDIYNETGDLAIAGMMLGNEDAETVKVYAKRDPAALRKLTQAHWERASFDMGLVANGRKSDDGNLKGL